jgi:hypothetical protein
VDPRVARKHGESGNDFEGGIASVTRRRKTRFRLAQRPVLFGVAIGALFGVWNITYSLLFPLADDTVVVLLVHYGLMFALWGLAGFAAYRSTGHWFDAVKAAVIVAVVTQLVFGAANMIRVNLLLGTLGERADWQNMVARYQASEFESFRAFVNYDYAKQILPKLAAIAIIGSMCGLLGSGIASVQTVFRRAASNR